MSHVSSWLGPPTSINWMQLTSFLGSTAPGGLKGEELRQREAQKTERSRVQKIAARYTIAEMNFLIRIEPKHRLMPPMTRQAWGLVNGSLHGLHTRTDFNSVIRAAAILASAEG